MCKLFAMVNHEKRPIPAHLGTEINKALKHLFYINSYGQVDGSGIMYTNAKGKTEYIKDALPSTELINTKAFENAYKNLYKMKFVAGHTRYSTVGKNSEENSHPFHYGRYIGMQNGTIESDHKSIVPNKKSPCEVDSASVIWSLNEQGINATFDNYEGQGVFMFTDLEKNTFNIVKNDARTLNVTKVLGYDIYIFSTDAAALQLVADRSGLFIEDIKPVKNDTLFTYTFDNQVHERPLKVKEATYTYNYFNYRKSGYYAGWDDWDSYEDVDIYPIKSKPLSFTKNYTPPGTYICDCDMCGNPITTDHRFYADSISFDNAGKISCSDCVLEVSGMFNVNMYPIEGKTIEII